MKKIALGLVALSALSTAALANDRTEEGTAASRNVAQNVVTESAAAAAVSSGSDVSSFEAMKRYGIEANSGNGND